MKLTDNMLYICVLLVQLLSPFHYCDCVCQLANKRIRLYVMLCYVMLCYVMLCYRLLMKINDNKLSTLVGSTKRFLVIRVLNFVFVSASLVNSSVNNALLQIFLDGYQMTLSKIS